MCAYIDSAGFWEGDSGGVGEELGEVVVVLGGWWWCGGEFEEAAREWGYVILV